MVKDRVVNRKAQKEPVLSNKGQRSSMKQSKLKTEVSRRSSLRSNGKSPDLLYDFIEDTPKTSNVNTKESKEQKAKEGQKATKNQAKQVKGKAVKVTAGKTKKLVESLVTPKVVGGKKGSRVDDPKKHNVKKKIAPLPPPNFDDLSPISCDSSKKRTRRSNKQQLESEIKQPGSSKSNSNNKVPLDVPKLNLKDTESTFDDSAIFLSPADNLRKRSRGIEKSSTPIIPPKKAKSDNASKKPKTVDMIKNTSTPCESKPKMKTYTKLKVIEPECSPVQRTDTPTSDYASMDSIVDPSPSPLKPSKKKQGTGKSPTPAFNLEDNFEPEPLSLNRSINSNYSNQKTGKKKSKSSTYNDEKVEEWASKVNSELEDIENFELSVEG